MSESTITAWVVPSGNLTFATQANRRSLYILLSIISLALLLAAAGTGAFAQNTPAGGLASPPLDLLSIRKAAEEISGDHQKVKVGFYFNSAGKIDFQTSSLPLDFYMWMMYRGTEEPKFEFMNCRMTTIEKQEEHKPYAGTDVNYMVFKVSGLFDQNIDYRNYPFDSFTLRVLLEDVEQEFELREYIPDEKDSALDPAFHL
ncbi:MAG TPA: hypothetical protein PLY73_09310, partial [Candidatus Ozemobacteraceae bacterium]|nr:hypothetical protein [Candidatus Ozemobacteraceae bacterium]